MFIRQFYTERPCLEFLFDQEWGAGFSSRRFPHKNFTKVNKWNYNRCSSRKYDESSTAHALFNKLMFPIDSVFTILYVLRTIKKGMRSFERTRQFNIHKEIAWVFKRKVQEAMSISSTIKLKDNIVVDEPLMRGFNDPRTPGSSWSKKRAVEIFIEVDYSATRSKTRKIKEVQAIVIEDCSAVSVRDHGTNFKLLYLHIFNLKNWLHGIHHHVSRVHLQSYLDEFNYSFNRRNHGHKIVFGLLSGITSMPQRQYSKLIVL